ncbi:hypothetical protein QOZ80_7BG0583100 [Eleusine coracana subsp. coracana]|nr:hypothetical protein QOZ80_7BG0583100 [Eleusine coracana subsp. coracana]
MVVVALSYMTPICVGRDVCSPSNLFGNDMGLKNEDGALQFPVFHWKHPCLQQLDSSPSAEVHPAAEASPVVARDEIHKGKFLMVIGLGTPAIFNLVSIDTGSTLSWVQCQPCQIWCKSRAAEAGPTFDPRNSTTYQRVSCSSRDCADVHELLGIPFGCVEETDTCLYRLRYGSGPLAQYSVGKLGKDTLRLTLTVAADDDFIFGCSEDVNFAGLEAGIIGFGNDRLSFFNQVAAARETNAFSYCFPSDHAARGFLSIGPYARGLLEFTNLVFGYGRDGRTFVYSLQQVGMMEDGRRLDVDSWMYTSQMMVVDSGTELTFLLAPVFDALDKAVTAAMAAKGYARHRLMINDQVCYGSSTSTTADDETLLVDWSNLPTVEMSFTGGATLKLPPQNVFDQRLVESERLLCLPFQPRDAGINGVQILGNKVTRSVRLVFDLQARMIGFQPNAC